MSPHNRSRLRRLGDLKLIDIRIIVPAIENPRSYWELFPTYIRAMAQGFIYDTGRARSALASAAVGLLFQKKSVAAALGATAGFFALVALVVFLFLPETPGGDPE